MSWIKNLLDLVYPPRCFLCRELTKGENLVCFSCQEKMNLFSQEGCSFSSHSLHAGQDWLNSNTGDTGHTGDSCFWCAGKELYFSGMYALGPYQGELKRLVKMYKYEGKKEVADFFTPYLAREIGLQIKSKKWLPPQGIVPIPLHPGRAKERRFNQSRVLADKLAVQLKIPVMDILNRDRDTRTQTRLSRTERFHNVKGAFSLVEGEKPANCLLVVDDICTSGATLNEAARVLKKEGAQSLYAAVIGR